MTDRGKWPTPIDKGFMWGMGTIMFIMLAMVVIISINDPIIPLILGGIVGVPTLVGFIAYRLEKRKIDRP